MAGVLSVSATHVGSGVYVSVYHRPDKHFKLSPTIKIQQFDPVTKKMDRESLYEDYRFFLFSVMPSAQIVIFDQTLDPSRDFWTFPTIHPSVHLHFERLREDNVDKYRIFHTTTHTSRPDYQDLSLSVKLVAPGLSDLVDIFNNSIDVICVRCGDDFHRLPCYLENRPVDLICSTESVKVLYEFIDFMNENFKSHGFTLNDSLMRLVSPNEFSNIFAGQCCPKKFKPDVQTKFNGGKPDKGPGAQKAVKRPYSQMSANSSTSKPITENRSHTSRSALPALSCKPITKNQPVLACSTESRIVSSSPKASGIKLLRNIQMIIYPKILILLPNRQKWIAMI